MSDRRCQEQFEERTGSIGAVGVAERSGEALVDVDGGGAKRKGRRLVLRPFAPRMNGADEGRGADAALQAGGMRKRAERLSDGRLLRAFQAGSDAALSRLAERHLSDVYAMALRQLRDPHLAEDVTQAALIILARKARQLEPDVVLGAWLFRVVRYCAMSAQRAEQRRRHHELGAAVLLAAAEQSQPAHRDDLGPLLERYVSRLRSRDRQAVQLRFYARRTYAEVGAAMGCSAEAARKRVNRAVETLRERLVESEGFRRRWAG